MVVKTTIILVSKLGIEKADWETGWTSERWYESHRFFFV